MPNEEVSKSINSFANKQVVDKLNEVLPYWAFARISEDGQTVRVSQISSAYTELPIHLLRPQSELVVQRGKRVILSNGEVVPRGFHNPIASGDSFHVAWQRAGASRKPIHFVLEPTLYYIKKIIEGIQW